jgi:hypothetical protein
MPTKIPAIDSSSIRIENIQPILSVKDMARSRTFYVDILGGLGN